MSWLWGAPILQEQVARGRWEGEKTGTVWTGKRTRNQWGAKGMGEGETDLTWRWSVDEELGLAWQGTGTRRRWSGRLRLYEKLGMEDWKSVEVGGEADRMRSQEQGSWH